MDQPVYRTLIPLFEELRGPRVIVRPYQTADATALLAAIAESRDYILPWLPPAYDQKTVEQSRDWIIQSEARWLRRENLNMSIWAAADPARFLGGVGLYRPLWDVPRLEIGYWLRKSAAGQGYMAEAARLVVDYAFARLGAHCIQLCCDERNTASVAVAHRLGFHLDARLRNASRAADGTCCTLLVFSRIPGDP